MSFLVPHPRRAAAIAALVAAALALAGCGSSKSQDGGAGGRGGAKGPITVGFVVVQQGSAPIVQDLPGRVSAFQVADVRPQVNGVILKRMFQEGSIVRQGQMLYQIDPSIYNAQAAQAQANLQSARAQAEAARTLVSRYRPLVKQEAISKQDYTNAVAQARQADAAVAQNSARLAHARKSISATPACPRPITGRIGLSNVTEGALVTANQTDALTTITRLDPVFVDIQQSAADLLALRQSLAQGGVVPTTAQVRLKLPDGSFYGYTGTVEFSQVLVDQSTGTVTLRARFPNPQSLLLPGMFVTAQFAQAIDTSAFLVPQPAVTRDPKGERDLVGRRARQSRSPARRRRRADAGTILGRHPGPRARREGDHARHRAILRTARKSSPCRPARRSGQGAAARRHAWRSRRRAAASGMSKIFIDRPIFAWVIAIIIMLMGIGAIVSLPVAQYPDVAPTQINIRATYPGASAATLESSVTQILEQQLTGIDGMLYFQSSSTSRGQVSISVILRKGRRPRHRAGPGPERHPGGDLAASAAGAAAGRARHQGCAGPAADRRHLRQDRPEHELRRFRLADDEHAGRAVARAGCRRRQRLRLILCDAHLARPAQTRRASSSCPAT